MRIRGGYYLTIMVMLISVSAVSQLESTFYTDTLGDFVFDSLRHDLGKVDTHTDEALIIEKKFKYIGTEPIKIGSTWTSDPHHICNYPMELLIPGESYSLRICMYVKGRAGRSVREVGFITTSGDRITLEICFVGSSL